jgi:hypothetical protein
MDAPNFLFTSHAAPQQINKITIKAKADIIFHSLVHHNNTPLRPACLLFVFVDADEAFAVEKAADRVGVSSSRRGLHPEAKLCRHKARS